MAEPAEPVDDATVRRLVLVAVGSLVLFVLAAAVAALAAHRDDDPSAMAPGAAASGVLVPGVDVASYVAGRQRDLANVSGEANAVVSFDHYQPEAEARGRLRDVEVRALLVAPFGGAPAVVTGDLDRWAAKARRDAEEERRQFQSMIETTSQADFKAQFQADLDRLALMLTALDPKGPIVFGAVVRAEGEALRALAGDEAVRLVDRVPAGNPDLSFLRGLRPEETVKAGTPPTRPTA